MLTNETSLKSIKYFY